MKKWFTRLGWLDAISIFILWMLLFREHRIFIALPRFSTNLNSIIENNTNNNPDAFIMDLAMQSLNNFLLIILFVILQSIKILRRRIKK